MCHKTRFSLNRLTQNAVQRPRSNRVTYEYNYSEGKLLKCDHKSGIENVVIKSFDWIK